MPSPSTSPAVTAARRSWPRSCGATATPPRATRSRDSSGPAGWASSSGRSTPCWNAPLLSSCYGARATPSSTRPACSRASATPTSSPCTTPASSSRSGRASSRWSSSRGRRFAAGSSGRTGGRTWSPSSSPPAEAWPPLTLAMSCTPTSSRATCCSPTGGPACSSPILASPARTMATRTGRPEARPVTQRRSSPTIRPMPAPTSTRSASRCTRRSWVGIRIATTGARRGAASACPPAWCGWPGAAPPRIPLRATPRCARPSPRSPPARRRSRWLVLGAGAAALASVGVALWPDRCAQAEPDRWAQHLRPQLHDALGEASFARVAPLADDWVRSWSERSEAACRADAAPAVRALSRRALGHARGAARPRRRAVRDRARGRRRPFARSVRLSATQRRRPHPCRHRGAAHRCGHSRRFGGVPRGCSATSRRHDDSSRQRARPPPMRVCSGCRPRPRCCWRGCSGSRERSTPPSAASPTPAIWPRARACPISEAVAMASAAQYIAYYRRDAEVARTWLQQARALASQGDDPTTAINLDRIRGLDPLHRGRQHGRRRPDDHRPRARREPPRSRHGGGRPRRVPQVVRRHPGRARCDRAGDRPADRRRRRRRPAGRPRELHQGGAPDDRGSMGRGDPAAARGGGDASRRSGPDADRRVARRRSRRRGRGRGGETR